MTGRPFAGTRLTAVAVACCLAIGGCGASHGPTKATLFDALVTAGLPRGQARCASDKVFSLLSPAARQRLAEQGASGLDTPDATKLNSALATCVRSSTAG